MTGRERLMAIFEGRLPDRPAVKLWGLTPGQTMLHPAYQPVYDRALTLTDLMVGAGSSFHLFCGSDADRLVSTEERPTPSPEWVDVVTRVRTPEGELSSVYTRSTLGKPGYEKEHLLKEPSDIRRLLSIPYRPLPFSAASFREMERTVADRGIVYFGLDHAMYGLQRLIGSENFAFWSIECRDQLSEAIAVFAGRLRAHAELALNAGLGPVFGWVGPELCTPPLMSLADFEEWVYRVDQPLVSRIRERGGRVWVHCHGRMTPVIRRFADMGVDVLNPIEPPPMGDMSLPEAFAAVGDRMGLEGNLETHDLMSASGDRIRALVRCALEAGAGRRFILCPSSGYMEWPFPEPRWIENLLIFIEEGVRVAGALARR